MVVVMVKGLSLWYQLMLGILFLNESTQKTKKQIIKSGAYLKA